MAISNRPFQGIDSTVDNVAIAQVIPIFEDSQSSQACPILTNEEPGTDIIDECSVPNYSAPSNPEMPTQLLSNLESVINKYRRLFSSRPGYTEDAWHYIPNVGNLVKVPPRRIPAHYRTEVFQQLKTMLDEGIIQQVRAPGWHRLCLFPKSLVS